MSDPTADRTERPKELLAFLVRCWSDPGDELLVTVRSFSVYQAAHDARFEHPGYDNYDPVRFLPSAPGEGADIDLATGSEAVSD